MAKPKKGVVPPQLRAFLKTKKPGTTKKAMPAALAKKLGRKK